MTSHAGRLYALALALVVFFLAWATSPRIRGRAPRTDARGSRRSRRASSACARRRSSSTRSSAARWAVYRAELKVRRAQIAAAQQAARGSRARRCAS